MAKEFPGWLPIAVAAERYDLHYEALRRLVNQGIFTRGRFTSRKEQAPIYLRIEELDAWKRGGVNAVAAVKLKLDPNSDVPVPSHDPGGEG